jgi:hypothetical protein
MDDPDDSLSVNLTRFARTALVNSGRSKSVPISRQFSGACSAKNEPRLVEMVITPDGHTLGRCDGEASFKGFLEAAEDLIRNIHGVGPVAELDGDEIGSLVAKVAEIKRQR